MTLVAIITDLLNHSTRATRELPRGLWLVYYPPTGDELHRLIAGRYLVAPSETELDVVRDALLEALDRHESRVVVGLTKWNETANGDWHGYVVTWRFAAATDAFSADPDRAHHVRLALDHREQRQHDRRAAANKQTRRSGVRKPKPML